MRASLALAPLFLVPLALSGAPVRSEDPWVEPRTRVEFPRRLVAVPADQKGIVALKVL